MEEENKNLENQNNETVNTNSAPQIQENKQKKGLKIANIVLLCILVAAEVLALIYYIPGIKALLAKDLSALAIIAILPIYFLVTCGIFVLSIVMSILAKAWKKQLIKNQQSPTFFDKFLGCVGWLVVVLNVVGFLILYII